MIQNWKKYAALLMAIVIFAGCGANTQTEKKEDNKTQNASAMENKGQEAGTESKSELKNKGVKAPEFTLKDWDGNEVALSSLQGKKVYLKFWASWCHFCVEGMPDLAKLTEQDNDFEIYTIVAPGYSGEYSEEDFKSWYEKQGYSKNIKILFDEKGSTMQAYGVSGYPTNAFIGSDGVLVSKISGNAPNDQVIDRMNGLQ